MVKSCLLIVLSISLFFCFFFFSHKYNTHKQLQCLFQSKSKDSQVTHRIFWNSKENLMQCCTFFRDRLWYTHIYWWLKWKIFSNATHDSNFLWVLIMHAFCLSVQVYLGLPGCSSGKESAASVRDADREMLVPSLWKNLKTIHIQRVTFIHRTVYHISWKWKPKNRISKLEVVIFFLFLNRYTFHGINMIHIQCILKKRPSIYLF